MYRLSLERVVFLGSTIAIAAIASLGDTDAESPSAADAAAEATLMNGAKISIAQATATAESQLGGKAVDIALEASIGTLLYPVTLLNPDGTKAEATIDATTARPPRGWKLRPIMVNRPGRTVAKIMANTAGKPG